MSTDDRQLRSLWKYFFNKTQFIVTSLTACFQLYTRSAGVAYFIIGALSCSLSVKAVKKVIRQPRPAGRLKKSTYGMPSTHSAAITYYASYICAASLYLPLHKSLAWTTHDSSVHLRVLVPIVVVPWASMIVLSRIWLGHHTWKQVAVGSAYGASFAGLWFVSWVQGGLSAFGNLAEDRVVTFLNLA